MRILKEEFYKGGYMNIPPEIIANKTRTIRFKKYYEKVRVKKRLILNLGNAPTLLEVGAQEAGHQLIFIRVKAF